MTNYAQGGHVSGGSGFWLDGCAPRYIAYPAPALSPAEAEIVARFEAAPTPPEVVDAVVAEIASRYRDPDGARFAINDFRDWLDDHPAAVAAYRAQDGGAEEAVRDDREPKVCPRCGQTCTYDGWDHVHKSGYGIGSCVTQADDAEGDWLR